MKISNKSHLARINALRQQTITAGADATVIQSAANRAYLTGFASSEGLLVVTATQAFLIVDPRYYEDAVDSVQGLEVLQHRGEMGEAVQKLILDYHLKNIGIEENIVTLQQAARWQLLMPEVHWLNQGGVTEQLRMIKDQDEISSIRYSCAIADAAFRELLKFIRPGRSEQEIAIYFDYQSRQLGADGQSFETIVISGPRSSLPHGRPTSRCIAEHELIMIDFGVISQGYCSDCTRTIVLGGKLSWQQELTDVVWTAQQAVLSQLRPGLKACEADRIAREIIYRQGWGDLFGHALGHGVGREIHERPSLSVRDNTVLQSGMVVTVEPGVYLPHQGGVRIEDLVLITDQGCELLTKSPY